MDYLLLGKSRTVMDLDKVIEKLEKLVSSKPEGYELIYDGILRNAEGVAMIVGVNRQEILGRIMRDWIRLGLDFEVYPLASAEEFLWVWKRKREEEKK
ncbi:MAG: DUF3303 family protein [Candidatus Syntropharchaeia archaeon]